MTGPRNTPHLDARIYRPITTEWREDARCREEDPELFFYPENERGAPKERRAAEARKLCRDCSVAAACVAEAVRIGEDYGIFGAFDFSDPLERERARQLVTQEAAA